VADHRAAQNPQENRRETKGAGKKAPKGMEVRGAKVCVSSGMSGEDLPIGGKEKKKLGPRREGQAEGEERKLADAGRQWVQVDLGRVTAKRKRERGKRMDVGGQGT